MQVSFVEVDGTTVLVRRWEKEGGRTVLYWHGGGGGSSEIPELAPVLAAAGYSVYAPDAPGYGGSPALEPGAYRPSLLADLAVGLIDTLGIAPVKWIGSSWGATMGIVTVVRAPERVRTLALLDGGYLEARDDPDYDTPLTLEARTAELRALAAQGESWDAAPEVVARVIHAADQEPCSILLPALASSAVPVLLLRATEPPEVESIRTHGLERFRAAVPRAETIAIPGAGHPLLNDAGPKVVRILLDWLART